MDKPSNLVNKKTPLGSEDQLVGGYVPRQAADLVALLALQRRVSKSQIMRDFIAKVLPSDTKTINSIVNEIALRSVQDFIYQKKSMVFSQYRRLLRKRFAYKGISQPYIEMIIRETEKIYDANKKGRKVKYPSETTNK